MRRQIRVRARKYIDRARNRFTMREIAEKSGLALPQLVSLRSDYLDSQTIPKAHLEALCQFLVDHRIDGWEELPSGFFEFEDPHLFAALARQENVITVVGVRNDLEVGDFLSAQDSQLQNNVLHRMTKEGFNMNLVQVMDQVTVETWPMRKGWNFDEISKNATLKYEELQKQEGDYLHFYSGTVKSNPAIELVIAGGFKDTEAFKSQDDVMSPSDRSCPFYMCYRKEDKKPTSAISGTRLCAEQPKTAPGFYYEGENGQWRHLPYDAEHDAAIVYYRINRVRNAVDLVMGGFTATATGYLANFVRTADENAFWPPTHRDVNLQIGMFMVQFTKPARGQLKTDVISLSDQALERRIQRVRVRDKGTAD